MRIPVFEEIVIRNAQYDHLYKTLLQSNVGIVPSYINTHLVKREEINSLIPNIVKILTELNIYPYFPYPLYVVSSSLADAKVIPVVRSIKDLPNHFFARVKRLKGREVKLLNKDRMLSSKISNVPLFVKHFQLKSLLNTQNDLYDKCKEIDFYQKIIQQLE